MTESLIRLLMQLSEGGQPAILWGRQTKPYPDRDLDWLLARGVLTEQAPADEWGVCSDCECGLRARPIQRVEGDLIAACPLDHARDARLDAHDLRSFSINAAAICYEIVAASGFGEHPSEVMNRTGRLAFGQDANEAQFVFRARARQHPGAGLDCHAQSD